MIINALICYAYQKTDGQRLRVNLKLLLLDEFMSCFFVSNFVE